MAEPTTDVANDSIENRKDVDDKPLLSKFWLGEVTAAKKRDSQWIERADKVIARYRDERNSDRTASSERRANILWSNTETLKSTLFSGIGSPDVRRRFPKKGQDDKAARQAALVLERGLSYSADCENDESQIEACVEDNLLPGRGTAWIVYDAEVSEYGEGTDSSAEDDSADNPQMQAPEISAQTVKIEHVFFKDFLTSAGRKWSDVWWAARGHDYSRDELNKYFPKHGKDIPLDVEIAGYDHTRRKAAKGEEDTFRRARVWEIWDKSKRERIYVAEGYKAILKKDGDPYKLKDFFPTVEPLYGVKTTSTLTPIPEYTLYQDQAEELDRITTRLARLVEALKRRGVYDASMEGPDNQLSKMIDLADNEFAPIRNFAALMEKGGITNVYQCEDLKPIIEVIDKLSMRAQMLVQQIYEITGIADVMRGASDPNETLGAQKIKAQFGSIRIQRRQKRIQAFIRDLFRLKAEIMAEHFTREQLVEMTGIDMPLKAEQDQAKQMLASFQQQQQMAQQAAKQGAGAVAAPPQPDPKVVQELLAKAKAVTWEEISGILRSDQRRGYKVDVETDATNAMDSETEKAQRMEFLTAMQGFASATLEGMQQLPPEIATAMVPFFKENAMFAVGAFKAGRTMEETYEDTFTQIEQAMKASAAKPPKPNPEEQKLQLEAKSKQMEFEFKAKEAEQDRQHQQAEFAHTSKLKEQEMMHAQKLEEFKVQNEAALAQRKMEQEQQFRAMEFDNQQRMNERQAQADFQSQSRQSALKEQEADRSFALQDRKMAQADESDQRKQAFEREKFERQAVAEGQAPQGGADHTSQLVQALKAEVEQLEAQMSELITMMMGGQQPQPQPA